MKYLLVLIFSTLTIVLSAQNDIKSYYESEEILLELMQNHIHDNPNDDRAEKIYFNQLDYKNAIDNYLNKKSNMAYTKMEIAEQHSFMQSLKQEDLQLAEMVKTFNLAKRERHEYFSLVSVDYKNKLKELRPNITKRLNKKRNRKSKN